MKKNRFLLLLLVTFPALAFAQGNINDFLKGSAADAKYLVSGYTSPFLKAFGYGLNQGWYNTAKPHKFPGLDITVTVSPIYVPASDKVFKVDNTKLTNVQLVVDAAGKAVGPTETGTIPSIMGAKTSQGAFNRKPVSGTNFSAPPGLGLPFLPVPIAGIGIGLPKGFDLKFRYVPTIDLSDIGGDVTGKFSLFGVGVMHDFKQYIPGIKALPFDLSAFVGYTKMKLNVGLNGGGDRMGEFSCAATTIQAVVSKKLAVLTGYAGLGYNIATTKLGVKGTYDLDGDGVQGEAGEKDPVQLSESSSGPRATVGLRLKLAVIAFHADYTLQKYNALTVGFGINVR